MEMTYDGVLVMPCSYAMMDEEEMLYLEGGGWSTYKGLEAVCVITNIIAVGAGFASLTKTVAESLLATTLSGVGFVIAIGLAFGVSVLATATVYQYELAIKAASSMVYSLKKYGNFNKAGFKACSYSAWKGTIYTDVEFL